MNADRRNLASARRRTRASARRRGNTMVRSSEVLGRDRYTRLDEHYQTPPFEYPELLPALATGGGVVPVDGGASLVVHYPLSSSGWSYVLLVDADAVVAP